jgi:predicted RecA/RadA family phage recombinase
MSNGYKGEGSRINYTTTGNVTEGALIQFTNIVGVALNTATTGATLPCAIEGEFTLTKTAAADTGFTQGDAVYVTSTGKINNTATGDLFVGFASAAAVTGATSVDVILRSA